MFIITLTTLLLVAAMRWPSQLNTQSVVKAYFSPPVSRVCCFLPSRLLNWSRREEGKEEGREEGREGKEGGREIGKMEEEKEVEKEEERDKGGMNGEIEGRR